MRFQFGNANLDLIAMDPIAPDFKDAKFYGANWSLIYTWWCDRKYGWPLLRPSHIKADADLKITNQLYVDYTMMGHNTPEASYANWKVLFKETGLNGRSRIQKQLDALFPPQRVPIPYDKLIDPNAEGESRELYAVTAYLRWAFFLSDPPGNWYKAAKFVLQVPFGIQFHTRTIGTCAEGPLDVDYGFWNYFNARLKPNGALREMAREHNEETKERRRLLEDPDKDPERQEDQRER